MVKRITAPLIIAIILIASVVYARKMLTTSASKDSNQYRVAAVKTDLVKKTVTATGVLKPWTTVDIKSKAGGRVDQLPVEEGSEVKKGKLIAKIDPTDTLLTYNEAKADIDANRYRVEETRNQLLLQKRQTEVALDTARANLASAKAQANAAKARYLSSQSQSDAQNNLTDASIENVKASLSAEQEKLDQMTNASSRSRRSIPRRRPTMSPRRMSPTRRRRSIRSSRSSTPTSNRRMRVSGRCRRRCAPLKPTASK